MSKCVTFVREIRFVIDNDSIAGAGLIHCYVAVQAVGDCPRGVQGWHHKAFAPPTPVVDILAHHFDDYLSWPLGAPSYA